MGETLDLKATIRTLKRINKQLTDTDVALVTQERLITPDQRAELTDLLSKITGHAISQLHMMDNNSYQDTMLRAALAFPADNDD